MAARMDPNDGSILGDPVEIVSRVRAAAGIHSYSVSNTGLLAYMPEQPDRSPCRLRSGGSATSESDRRAPGPMDLSVSPDTRRLFLGGDVGYLELRSRHGWGEKLFTGPGSSPVPGPGDTLVAYLYWHLLGGMRDPPVQRQPGLEPGALLRPLLVHHRLVERWPASPIGERLRLASGSSSQHPNLEILLCR